MSELLADPTTFDALADGTVATPWPPTAPGKPVSVKGAPGVARYGVLAAAGRRHRRHHWLHGDLAPADASAPAQTVELGPTTGKATFTGLTNGAAYTFTVQARNGVGRGIIAAPTTTVVPQNPTAFTASGPSVLSYGAAATVHGLFAAPTPTPCSPRCRSACRPASSARPPGSGSRRRRPTEWAPSARP